MRRRMRNLICSLLICAIVLCIGGVYMATKRTDAFVPPMRFELMVARTMKAIGLDWGDGILIRQTIWEIQTKGW